MRKSFGVQSWFYPLPVLIIGTYDAKGNPNAMNAAWGGLYDSDLVELCLGSNRKTMKNLLETKAFTISFGDAAHVAACDYVGLASGNNTPDKMEKAGFTTEKSAVVNAPLIRELPLALECEFVRTTQEGNVIGRIVNISADESILDENGKLDMTKFHPIAFEPAHNGYHVLGERVGDAFKDGLALK